MVYPFFELNCVSLQTRLFGGPSSLKTSTTINLITALKATTLQRVFVINMYKQLIVTGHKYVFFCVFQHFSLPPLLVCFLFCFNFWLKWFLRLFVPLKCLKSKKSTVSNISRVENGFSYGKKLPCFLLKAESFFQSNIQFKWCHC